MCVQAVSPECESHHLQQVIGSVLHIHVFGILDLSALIDVQDFTTRPTLCQLFGKKLGLPCPTTFRRRIVADFQYLASRRHTTPAETRDGTLKLAETIPRVDRDAV